MIKLNENLKERRMGFFFMFIYIGIFLVYLFFDGWLYEWLHYGYAGANQHWDFNIFGDMNWEIVNGEIIYNSTNNLHNLIYMCYWTATISWLALITGNKWLKQGSMATLAFPVISLFSTINPIVASDVFTLDVFRYHAYFLQIIYDINHLSGTIMGVYIFYQCAKAGEDIDLKKITPAIMFTWLIFFVSRVLLQKWPFWDPANRMGMISTNQINNMPFFAYGLEYIIVVGILYFINIGVKFVNSKIENPKLKTLIPFAFFTTITIVMVAVGLIVLQIIPWESFVQY